MKHHVTGTHAVTKLRAGRSWVQIATGGKY